MVGMEINTKYYNHSNNTEPTTFQDTLRTEVIYGEAHITIPSGWPTMHSAEDILTFINYFLDLSHVNERVIIYTVTRCRDILYLTLKGFQSILVIAQRQQLLRLLFHLLPHHTLFHQVCVCFTQGTIPMT